MMASAPRALLAASLVACSLGVQAVRMSSKPDARTVSSVSRRHSLVAGASLIGALTPLRAGALSKGADYAGAKAALKEFIAADPDIGPTMLRLAWHSSVAGLVARQTATPNAAAHPFAPEANDALATLCGTAYDDILVDTTNVYPDLTDVDAGTYDAMTKTGGSGGGTIRFTEELAHGGNAGLDKMVATLEPLHERFPQVSYADLYTLGGVVAIEEAGGPQVAWRAGRVDALSPDAVTPDGRLPGADKGRPIDTANHLRKDVFYRMGFDDREIVALSGAHALGRCHPDASGYAGPWTPTPTRLTTGYYNLLLGVPWTIKKWDGPMQFEDPSGKLMMLPSDIVLIQDADFRPFVQMYAKDQKLFFEDFAKAFQKLEELGTTNLKAVKLG